MINDDLPIKKVILLVEKPEGKQPTEWLHNHE